jgi:viroplasmin and RNaseH domain-containing protein
LPKFKIDKDKINTSVTTLLEREIFKIFINRSVDELMSMNVSHFENINKYEQLSKYIIRANSIQAEINHYLR